MNLLSLFGFFIGVLFTISVAIKVYARHDISGGMLIILSLGWTLFATRWLL